MTTIEVRCRHCGALVAPDERFCGECGRPRPDTADTGRTRDAPLHEDPSRTHRGPPPDPQRPPQYQAAPEPSPPPPPAPVPPRPSRRPRTRTALATLAGLAVVGVIAFAVYREQDAPGALAPQDATQPPPADTVAAPSAPAASPDAQAPPGFDLLGIPAASSLPDATSPVPAPLVGDDALRWAEANGFDRWKARESLAEGLRHYHGQGVPVDYQRARASFEVAAQYEGRAAYYLAGMYQNGRGVPTDIGVSLQWLHRGAQLGDADAQFALGGVYLDGVTGFIVPNVSQGLHWLTLSANQGHRGANERLSQLRVR